MLLETNKVKHRGSYKKVSNEEDHGIIHKLEDKNTFYSSFHDTRERRQYSKEEWDEFTKMSTKKALESLVCSPDFNRWAVAHADRITLRPKNDTSQRRQSWLPWSWSSSRSSYENANCFVVTSCYLDYIMDKLLYHCDSLGAFSLTCVVGFDKFALEHVNKLTSFCVASFLHLIKLQKS